MPETRPEVPMNRGHRVMAGASAVVAIAGLVDIVWWAATDDVYSVPGMIVTAAGCAQVWLWRRLTAARSAVRAADLARLEAGMWAALHYPAIAQYGEEGHWGVYCIACSNTAEDYVFPCRVREDLDPRDWPTGVLADPALVRAKVAEETEAVFKPWKDDPDEMEHHLTVQLVVETIKRGGVLP